MEWLTLVHVHQISVQTFKLLKLCLKTVYSLTYSIPLPPRNQPSIRFIPLCSTVVCIIIHVCIYVCMYNIGDYDVISSDVEENTDNSDDDGDDDDNERDKDDDAAGARFPDSSNSDEDADDSNDAEFNQTHKPLRGTFKTAAGISVTVVKGSISAQKVTIAFVYLLVTV